MTLVIVWCELDKNLTSNVSDICENVLIDIFVPSGLPYLFNDAQPSLDMADYRSLNIHDQDLCPEHLLCTKDEMLLALDITKSSGPDGISGTMLKQTAVSIAPSVTNSYIIMGAIGGWH